MRCTKRLDSSAAFAVFQHGDGVHQRFVQRYFQHDFYFVRHDGGVGRIDESGIRLTARDVIQRLAHVLCRQVALAEFVPESGFSSAPLV